MTTPTGAGFTDPNFPNPHGPHDARIVIYGYTPNFALCILGIVLFAVSFFLHFVQLVRHRTWYFAPFSLACVMEVLGYIFRSLSSRKDPYHVIYFVIQYFCIVTAPVFISASIYVCLSKLIGWATLQGFDTTSRRWLNPRLILWGFIACDIAATVAQIAGAALIGSAESNQKSPTTPNDILLAGLAFQTFAFTIFLALLSAFVFSLRRDLNFRSAWEEKASFIFALGSTSLLVFLRTIFRLAETSQGVFGYLSSHEVYFGVLEFTPVVIAVWIMVVWHPGRWLPGGALANHQSTVSSSPSVRKEGLDETV
ncbi:hypothetical protein MMC07_001040 [Pseudocyphellaria aurata]|nr:hypothetical protein [Pseudocyphellaria aurata]